MLLGDVAVELGVDRNTVTAAWRHWHASRGLPAPDGRTRRKSLPKGGAPRTADPATDESPAADKATGGGPLNPAA